MAKIIRNIDSISHTYAGQEIAAGASYTIQQSEQNKWLSSDSLFEDIANAKAQVNDGISDISGTSNQINFLKDINTDPKDAAGYPLVRSTGLLEPQGHRARLVGSHSINITGATTVTSDWQIPQLTYQGVNKNSFFNGVEYYAKNATMGDKVTFQAIDKDNVFGYGANTILDEFAKDFYITPNSNIMIELYLAQLYVGIYIRILYTSANANGNCDFVVNLIRHMKQ